MQLTMQIAAVGGLLSYLSKNAAFGEQSVKQTVIELCAIEALALYSSLNHHYPKADICRDQYMLINEDALQYASESCRSANF